MRKAVILTIALLSAVPAATDARGMYCTRHRQECDRRRIVDAAAAKAEAARYASLTPAQKAVEDARAAKIAAINEAEWNRGVIARQKEAEADAASSRHLAIAIGAVIALATAAFIVLLAQAVKDDR